MIDKIGCLFRYLLRYLGKLSPDGFNNMFHRILPIENFPDGHAHRIYPNGISGIWVEKDRPVVKLLSEDDQRIGYGRGRMFHNLLYNLYWMPVSTAPAPLDYIQKKQIQKQQGGKGRHHRFPCLPIISIGSEAIAAGYFFTNFSIPSSCQTFRVF